MQHKHKNALLVGLAIAVLYFGISARTQSLDPRDWSWERLATGEVPQEDEGPGPTPGPTPGITTGLVTTDVAAFDSLEIATTRTVGTDVNVYWYALRNAQWILLGSGDATDINVEAQDQNVIYGVCAIPSAKTYYVDYAKILSMNSRATSVEYKDIDGDNVEDWAFRLDVKDVPFASGTGKYAMPCFNVYLLTYDSSFSIPTGGQPADLTSVGTTKVTKYLEWYTEMSAEKKAVALCKVVLTVNTSDISKVTLKKLNIPGVGYLDGSSLEQDVLTSSIKWTYTISTLLHKSDYIQLPVNTMNKFEFTTAVEVDLTTGDVLNFTLTLYWFDQTESQQTTNDAVIVSA